MATSAITRTAISSSLHDHGDEAGDETVTYPDMINRPIHDMPDDSDVGMHAVDDNHAVDEEDQEEDEGMEELISGQHTTGSSSGLDNRSGGKKGLGNGARTVVGKNDGDKKDAHGKSGGGGGGGGGSMGQRTPRGTSSQQSTIVAQST